MLKMTECSSGRRLGVWMPDRKIHKINWSELKDACAALGYGLIRLDIERGLEEQGPLDVLLHKLTDVITLADAHDAKAMAIVGNIEQYLSNHPEVTVVDPIPSVRVLLNRFRTYSIVAEDVSLRSHGVFTPPFAELTHHDERGNAEALRRRGVRFPLVLKPLVAHGSKAAHEMALVFNAHTLAAVLRGPSVAQTFVNHDARLYKIFVVGDRYHIVERPSVKNLSPSNDREPIRFFTADVCKAHSRSALSVLDARDALRDRHHTVCEDKIRHIVNVLRHRINLLLFGFDVVMENSSGRHAVIDINVYPGYDKYPDFYTHLVEAVHALHDHNSRTNTISDHAPDTLTNGCPH